MILGVLLMKSGDKAENPNPINLLKIQIIPVKYLKILIFYRFLSKSRTIF